MVVIPPRSCQHDVCRSPTLRGLGFVVMDEVHYYLADRFRGPVWEGHHPPAEDVQWVSLSATVSNAEEFGAWLAEVRGNHEVIVSEHRPVPLWQHMMVGQDLHDLFVDETSAPTASWTPPASTPTCCGGVAVPSSEGVPVRRPLPGPRAAQPPGQGVARPGRRTRRSRVRRRGRSGAGDPRGGDLAPRPRRPAASHHLHLQPGRVRRRVRQLLQDGMRLIPQQEGERIRPHREERVQALHEEDLAVLGYWDFVEGLTRGFAAHHAGCCRRSGRSWRSCSPQAGSARSSPPRPLPWASTCRRGPS